MRTPVPRLPSWLLRRRAGAIVAPLALAALTAILAPVLGENEIVAVAMLFLLAVLLASALWGYIVGLASAVIADVLLNFFFIPPLHTVSVADGRNVVALAVFLAVAAVGASMLALLQRQLAVASERRAELTVMLGLSRELAAAPSPERALEALAWAVNRAVGGRRCEILLARGREWRILASTGDRSAVTRDEAALAQAAIETGQVTRLRAGSRANRPPPIHMGDQPVTDTFVPFVTSEGQSGVLRISGQLNPPPGGELEPLLAAFADEAGVAIHRANLAEQARRSEVLQRSDELKSALLSSVSHDLRSPLTAIKAAVGSLRSEGVELTKHDRAHLLEAIETQTDRLTNTVSDLLDMSRLEGGATTPALEPVQVAALLHDAASSAASETAGREVRVNCPDDIWAIADYGLLLQALGNLLQNAARYSTPGEPITLSSHADLR